MSDIPSEQQWLSHFGDLLPKQIGQRRSLEQAEYQMRGSAMFEFKRINCRSRYSRPVCEASVLAHTDNQQMHRLTTRFEDDEDTRGGIAGVVRDESTEVSDDQSC